MQQLPLAAAPLLLLLLLSQYLVGHLPQQT
jgi:hypothetical protein